MSQMSGNNNRSQNRLQGTATSQLSLAAADNNYQVKKEKVVSTAVYASAPSKKQVNNALGQRAASVEPPQTLNKRGGANQKLEMNKSQKEQLDVSENIADSDSSELSNTNCKN